MKFKYSARTKTGELQVGNVEAVNRGAALEILQGHDLYILNLEAARIPKWYAAILNFMRRIRGVDLMIFTRQLAAMLAANMPLSDALKSLYTQTKNLTLKETIFEMGADIDAGLSLSQTLERHGHIFSGFYINLIRSAEITGRVEEVMDFLADYLERELALISRVRLALIYPVFVLGLFVVVLGVLVAVVFPQLGPIFTEAGVQLPLFTQIFLNVGNFVARWWPAVIIGAAVLLVVAIDYLRGPEGRAIYGQLIIRVPVFGNLFKKVYVSRFAEGLAILIKGGIPISQAMEISGHTVDNVVYREVIHNIAERVRGGELFSQTLSRSEAYFPSLMGQMVAVGEKTGKLEEMLGRVSAFYRREVDDIVSNLVELIQPAIMVIIGALVGLLFASVLLPIYSLIQAF